MEIPGRMLKTRMRQTWRESPAGLNSQIFSTRSLESFGANDALGGKAVDNTTLIIVIIVVILVFGGGFYGWRRRR